MNNYNDKREKEILKNFPDNEFNMPVKHNNFILLTNPRDPNPLLSFQNKDNIIGLSDNVPDAVFDKGGKRKTRKTKSGSGKPKNITWRDKPLSQKWPNSTLRLLEEGHANLALPLEKGPTNFSIIPDIENGLLTPKKSILRKKKGGKSKKSIKYRRKTNRRKSNKRKSNKRKSNKRKSKKAGGPRMSIPQAQQEPNIPTIYDGDKRLRRINPNGPFADLEANIYPKAEAIIYPYHNPTLVIVPPKKK